MQTIPYDFHIADSHIAMLNAICFIEQLDSKLCGNLQTKHIKTTSINLVEDCKTKKQPRQVWFLYVSRSVKR